MSNNIRDSTGGTLSNAINAAKPEKRYALAWALTQCTMWEHLRAIPYMLVATSLRYAQPVVISRLIRFVSDPPVESQRRLEGVKLVVSVIVIYVGLAVSGLTLSRRPKISHQNRR